MRNRGSWQPVEPASCAIPCSVVEKPEDRRNDADCCIFEPAKTLVGTELAGGMQVFHASANLTRLMSLSKFKFEFLSIVLLARLCFNLRIQTLELNCTRGAIAVRREPNLNFVNCLMEG